MRFSGVLPCLKPLLWRDNFRERSSADAEQMRRFVVKFTIAFIFKGTFDIPEFTQKAKNSAEKRPFGTCGSGVNHADINHSSALHPSAALLSLLTGGRPGTFVTYAPSAASYLCSVADKFSKGDSMKATIFLRTAALALACALLPRSPPPPRQPRPHRRRSTSASAATTPSPPLRKTWRAASSPIPSSPASGPTAARTASSARCS